jgi:hypothetical protein
VTIRPRVVAGAYAALLSWALGAAAPTQAQEPAPTVEVTVVGTADDLERVRGLVPRLSAGGARWLRVDRLAPADVLRAASDDAATAAVRAWVDVSSPTRARLTFATRSGDHFLLRDVDLSGRFDEVDRAALAEVIESSIGALVANERAGLTRAEAEAVLAQRAARPPPPAVIAAPPSPPPPVPVPSPSRWAVGFFYAAQALAGAPTIDHGPGLALSVAAWRKFAAVNEQGRGPALFASAQYRLPIHEQTPRIGVALYTIAARAGVECGPLLWSRLRVRLGGGVDLVHIAPETSEPDAALTPTRWAASFVASASLRANLWRQPHRFWISMTLFADVLPTAVRYDVSIDGTTTSVFSPWRTRPGLTLELTFF